MFSKQSGGLEREKLAKELSWRRVNYMGLGFLLMLIVLGGAYSLMIFRTVEDRAESENLAANLAQARMGRQFILDHQEGLLARLMAITSRNSFRQAVSHKAIDDLRSYLDPILRMEQEVDSIFLTDPGGKPLLVIPAAGNLPARLGGLPLDNPHPWVSGVLESPLDPDMRVVTLSGPVTGIQNEPGGFLALNQRADYWQTFFSRLAARPGRTFHLFDQTGRLITESLGIEPAESAYRRGVASRVREESQTRESLAAWLNNPQQNGEQGRMFVAVARAGRLGWTLVVMQDFESAMASYRAMLENLIFFLGLLFLCILLLGFLLLSRYRMQQRLMMRLDDEARRLEALVEQRTTDLRESIERYRSLVQDLPDVIYEVNQEGKITFVSNAITGILGKRPRDLLGGRWRDLVHPEDHAKFDSERARVNSDQALSITALRHLTADGKVRWLSINSRRVVDGQGATTGRRGVARDVTQQVLAEKRVRDLSGRLIRAQEEERKRVALDLHDEMGQLLSALKIGLQALAQQKVNGEGDDVQKLVRLAQKIMDRIRALAYHLRPAILDSFGLAPALEDLCDSMNDSGLIEVIYELDEVREDLMTPEIKTSLFRFVQEALTNAVKHSHSDKVEVEMTGEATRVTIRVRDFGRGFDPREALAQGKHLGLMGMNERIGLMGGTLDIQSGEGGTTLVVEIDLGGEA